MCCGNSINFSFLATLILKPKLERTCNSILLFEIYASSLLNQKCSQAKLKQSQYHGKLSVFSRVKKKKIQRALKNLLCSDIFNIVIVSFNPHSQLGNFISQAVLMAV